MTTAAGPSYLRPYVNAVRKHGGSFESLLWASPATQRVRFSALVRHVDPRGLNVLDVGCGRADLLTYLIDSGLSPATYAGIEGVDALATRAGDRLALAGIEGRIDRRDFVADPDCLRAGSDVAFVSGALNTILDPGQFERSVLDVVAAAPVVAFNFLSSPRLASDVHLRWHDVDAVVALVRSTGRRVRVIDDYLAGDATVVATRQRTCREPRAD